MPMPKKDTIQRTIRLPKKLDTRLNDMLQDPVHGRTMYGGLSALVTEALERLLASAWWKQKLKRLRAHSPDYQLDVDLQGPFGSTERKTLDFFCQHHPKIPPTRDDPGETGGWKVETTLMGEIDVTGAFPELERLVEESLDEESEGR